MTPTSLVFFFVFLLLFSICDGPFYHQNFQISSFETSLLSVWNGISACTSVLTVSRYQHHITSLGLSHHYFPFSPYRHLLTLRSIYFYSWWKPQCWLKGLYFIFSLGSLCYNDVYTLCWLKTRTFHIFFPLLVLSRPRQVSHFFSFLFFIYWFYLIHLSTFFIKSTSMYNILAWHTLFILLLKNWSLFDML